MKAYHGRMMRAVGASLLMAAAIGCGGSGATRPGAAGGVMLGHAQGVLCSATAAGGSAAACARAGLTQSRTSLSIHTTEDGTLRLTAVVRDFDYEEYFLPTLTCNAAPAGWTEVSAKMEDPPAWWPPLMGTWPALHIEFVAPADANFFCDVSASFDLRSPPYSPYDITIMFTSE